MSAPQTDAVQNGRALSRNGGGRRNRDRPLRRARAVSTMRLDVPNEWTVEGGGQCAARRMSESLRVVFNSPQSGYMSVGLRAAGREFAAAVSCRPGDSLRELIAALTRLARGEAHAAVVRWNCEPDELDFRFESDGGLLKLAVVHHLKYGSDEPSGQTVFEAEGPGADILRAFRAALEELRADAEVDVFESNWRRKFPERELRELGDAGGAL
jgi:hypothetical protein